MANKVTTIVPCSQLQTRSKELVEQVRKTGQPIVITQQGRPVALLLRFDAYEGHLGTVEEMSLPRWEQRLKLAKREIRRGNFVSHHELSKRHERRDRKRQIQNSK